MIKKFLSTIVSALMVMSFAILPVKANSTVLNGSYTIIVGEYDWGVATPKAIVNVDQSIDSIDKDDLVVEELKEGTQGNVQTTRTVTDVYLCDEEGTKVNGESNYFAIEMTVSPTEGSPFIYKSFNEWADPYKLLISLTTNSDIQCDSTVITNLVIDQNKKQMQLSAGAQFDYSGKYTASDNTTYSYATYTPAQDNHKNPLVIWLHGGGEGGTNPQIAVLGNKVTGLISDEVQASLDNPYVFVPQCPTLWMDGYGTFEQTATGLKFTPSHTPSKYTESLMECIKAYVESNDDIDPNRIYVGGCSNGGYMTMQLVVSYTDYFAAAFPICTGYDATDLSEEDALRLKDFPLFITYCENDDTLDPNQFSRPLIEKLKAANPTNLHVFSPDDVHDTSGLYKDEKGQPYQYSTHWSWIYVLNNEAVDDNDASLKLFSWLGQQKKTVTQPQSQPQPQPQQKPEQTTDNSQVVNTAKDSVKTGDENHLSVYGMLFMASGLAFVYMKKRVEL